MSDIEKNQAQATEPSVELGSQQSKKFIDRVKGRTNDPNVLGKELLRKALEFDEPQLERDAVKVRRRLDWIVIPMVCSPHRLVDRPC